MNSYQKDLAPIARQFRIPIDQTELELLIDTLEYYQPDGDDKRRQELCEKLKRWKEL